MLLGWCWGSTTCRTSTSSCCAYSESLTPYQGHSRVNVLAHSTGTIHIDIPWLQILCVYMPVSVKSMMVCLEPERLMPSACIQCRGVFGEAQNALRARSVQRVQLWKGLHPSALSEAVSHFTKVHLSCFWHCS